MYSFCSMVLRFVQNIELYNHRHIQDSTEVHPAPRIPSRTFRFPRPCCQPPVRPPAIAECLSDLLFSKVIVFCGPALPFKSESLPCSPHLSEADRSRGWEGKTTISKKKEARGAVSGAGQSYKTRCPAIAPRWAKQIWKMANRAWFVTDEKQEWWMERLEWHVHLSRRAAEICARILQQFKNREELGSEGENCTEQLSGVLLAVMQPLKVTLMATHGGAHPVS